MISQFLVVLGATKLFFEFSQEVGIIIGSHWPRAGSLVAGERAEKVGSAATRIVLGVRHVVGDEENDGADNGREDREDHPDPLVDAGWALLGIHPDRNDECVDHYGYEEKYGDQSWHPPSIGDVPGQGHGRLEW